jgi:hypothetical protein
MHSRRREIPVGFLHRKIRQAVLQSPCNFFADIGSISELGGRHPKFAHLVSGV